MNRRLRAPMLALAMMACAGPAAAASTEAILDSLQYGAFRYFWDEANPSNGLIKDRSAAGSLCSIAANGFGFTAITIGVERGWVTRAAAAQRVRTTLQTFWNGPQGTTALGQMGYNGFFYHFLDMNTGLRANTDIELSSIDTALLLAGMLDARQYFDGADPVEADIRLLADQINRRVDWVFMRNGSPGVKMGWKPGLGFAGFGTWVGYNEAMILYLLALGSPTFPVPETDWNVWTSGYRWRTYFGYSYVEFAPLFGHQYSHCWVDFRGQRDAYMQFQGIDYFENSRRATLAQRAYSIAHPNASFGYSDSLWGITACDDPYTYYAAHGAPPAQNDNGTIAPTAAIASLPFAPEVVPAVVQRLWNVYKPLMWGPYGFRDAMNLFAGFFDPDYIGIDQGPIAIMIENWRTQAVWQRFMHVPEIQTGLTRAGFIRVVGVDAEPATPLAVELAPRVEPNPFAAAATVRFRLRHPGHVVITVHDVTGREVARPLDAERAAGEQTARFEGSGLPAGVYLVRLHAGGLTASTRCVRIR